LEGKKQNDVVPARDDATNTAVVASADATASKKEISCRPSKTVRFVVGLFLFVDDTDTKKVALGPVDLWITQKYHLYGYFTSIESNSSQVLGVL
jgi:hypothetical protein